MNPLKEYLHFNAILHFLHQKEKFVRAKKLFVAFACAIIMAAIFSPFNSVFASSIRMSSSVTKAAPLALTRGSCSTNSLKIYANHGGTVLCYNGTGILTQQAIYDVPTIWTGNSSVTIYYQNYYGGQNSYNFTTSFTNFHANDIWKIETICRPWNAC
jgi:hypothetical protein